MAWQVAARLVKRCGELAALAARSAARATARRLVPTPANNVVPQGRILDLAGRGRTFVVDVPGPTADAPTIVLLHTLACTAYLSWFPTFEHLSRTHRVLTFDLRWHGRGIRSPRFRFADCADDVAAVLDAFDIDSAVIAGYSMGGAVAQLTWRRHPDRVAGLVLCSTARNFRGKWTERAFFSLLAGATDPLSRFALQRVERLAETLPEMPVIRVDDASAWGKTEFRSTSAWSIPEVLGELGRFHSADWIGEVDVPSAVVVTVNDKVIPQRRQRRLAASISSAELYEAPGGHAALVLRADDWVPVFVAAVSSVTSRVETAEVPRGAAGAAASSD